MRTCLFKKGETDFKFVVANSAGENPPYIPNQVL